MNMKENTTEMLTRKFYACRKLLSAIGDNTRQAIIAALAENGFSGGLRVGEITTKTRLSRPAISHHLKILLDAEVIGVQPKGAMNFYFLRLEGEWQTLVELINQIEKLRTECCD